MMPTLRENEVRRLKAWVREDLSAPGMQRTETVLLKNGPLVFKTASLLHCGRSPDEVTSTELRLRTTRRDAGGSFVRDRDWACENEEIASLRQFLDAEFGAVGDYSLIAASGNAQTVLNYIARGELPTGFLASMAQAIVERVDIMSDLDEVEGVQLVGLAVDLRRQQRVMQELERVVLDAASSERDLQRVLQDNWWLLGGNYVGKLDRRRLVVLDEFDVPLIRADNVLHIVELKKANVPGLVTKHRSHFMVGAAINEAVNQAANYLRSVDEQRAQILADFGIECRRAQATVVIGHPTHNGQPDVSARELREAIRTYNSHLSRIEVLTFEDVIATASNAIRALAEHVENESSEVTVLQAGVPPPPATEWLGEDPF